MKVKISPHTISRFGLREMFAVSAFYETLFGDDEPKEMERWDQKILGGFANLPNHFSENLLHRIAIDRSSNMLCMPLIAS